MGFQMAGSWKVGRTIILEVKEIGGLAWHRGPSWRGCVLKIIPFGCADRRADLPHVPDWKHFLILVLKTSEGPFDLAKPSIWNYVNCVCGIRSSHIIAMLIYCIWVGIDVIVSHGNLASCRTFRRKAVFIASAQKMWGNLHCYCIDTFHCFAGMFISDPKLQSNWDMSLLQGRPFQRCANHGTNNNCFWQQSWHGETKVRLAIPNTEGRLCQTRDPGSPVNVTIIPWVAYDPMVELLCPRVWSIILMLKSWKINLVMVPMVPIVIFDGQISQIHYLGWFHRDVWCWNSPFPMCFRTDSDVRQVGSASLLGAAVCRGLDRGGDRGYDGGTRGIHHKP